MVTLLSAVRKSGKIGKVAETGRKIRLTEITREDFTAEVFGWSIDKNKNLPISLAEHIESKVLKLTEKYGNNSYVHYKIICSKNSIAVPYMVFEER